MRTGGGTRIEYKLIPNVKVGDEVWVFVNEWGEVQKIEPHTCKHGETYPQGTQEARQAPVNYAELDSVE